VGSIMVAFAPLISSSAVMFAAMEHLSSASGTVAIACKIGALYLHRRLCSVHLQ
jgi:hypothetical protein